MRDTDCVGVQSMSKVKGKEEAAGTINPYVIATKAFVQYHTDIDILTKNPLEQIYSSRLRIPLTDFCSDGIFL